MIICLPHPFSRIFATLSKWEILAVWGHGDYPKDMSLSEKGRIGLFEYNEASSLYGSILIKCGSCFKMIEKT